MDDKLVYIANDDEKNNTFLNYWSKSLDTTYFETTNQN